MSHGAGGAVATKEARAASAAARLAEAFAHFQAGRLDDAKRVCCGIVRESPDHGPAWHLLGLAAFSSGQVKEAAGLIRQALALNPGDATVSGNLGMVLQTTGELAEAEVCLERAVALNPVYAEAWTNLGNLRLTQGRLDDAVDCHRRAIGARRSYADAWCNLGVVLTRRKSQGDADEAHAAFKRAFELKQDFAEAHNNFGLLLQDRGEAQSAIEQFDRALALKPNYVEAHVNRGFALELEGRLDDATAECECALRLKPDSAEAQNNRGGLFQVQGDLESAMARFERSLELKPDCAEAHYNRGLLLLLRGDLQAGFSEYEWRWCFLPRRTFTMPLWRGEPLAGKRILLHAEQGVGDAIHFLRYAPMVAASGGEVVLEVRQSLVRLAQEMPGVSHVVCLGEDPPECDWQCPLMSLPLAFGTRLDTIPARVPYLSVPEAARRKMDALNWNNLNWSDLNWIGPDGTGPALRVGLVWAGSPNHRKDRYRSIPLQVLEGLLDVAGVRFFSLQVGGATEDRARARALGITDLAPQIEDLADTAALLQKLDLVISVDTAVAHLAGALGVRAWIMLPFAPDWRWLLGRSDSPWYPSLRLFRQPSPGDWPGVLQSVRDALYNQVATVPSL